MATSRSLFLIIPLLTTHASPRPIPSWLPVILFKYGGLVWGQRTPKGKCNSLNRYIDSRFPNRSVASPCDQCSPPSGVPARTCC
jgi:hypothetical protein